MVSRFTPARFAATLSGGALAALVAGAPALAGPPATTIADVQRNMSVTLAGTVDRITDEDEFVLRDATGTIRVYVGPNRVPAGPGEAVTVIGHVDDDRPVEVYATEMVRADGTRVSLPHRY
ncbi:hypothetical protein DLJ49_10910 [Rhodovulum sp. 12E13]|uniref:NirD/YgiW/YdeI family stress tolerance protein n=1 Tax=Rhodovulum sp. 12E13 TaxID=2203891 RepID=UPI000E14DFEB|nr:NirD/YgiW/YdeI family stress tolerance protein [Rhodovulum sp. 12E13]RDC72413.1 hypothetical protein DLJ49_10910 [Rhodovulum sp. 12E13]